MAEFTAADVGKLREMTGAGMMDCKKALVEAKGKLDDAVSVLRKKGQATASVKAARDAKDGAITSNMAIVPNNDGETDAYAGNGTTQLLLDISAYFAP